MDAGSIVMNKTHLHDDRHCCEKDVQNKQQEQGVGAGSTHAGGSCASIRSGSASIRRYAASPVLRSYRRIAKATTDVITSVTQWG
jgi:hypothetical protein